MLSWLAGSCARETKGAKRRNASAANIILFIFGSLGQRKLLNGPFEKIRVTIWLILSYKMQRDNRCPRGSRGNNGVPSSRSLSVLSAQKLRTASRKPCSVIAIYVKLKSPRS